MRDIEVIDKQTKDKVKQSHRQNREKVESNGGNRQTDKT